MLVVVEGEELKRERRKKRKEQSSVLACFITRKHGNAEQGEEEPGCTASAAKQKEAPLLSGA